MRNAALLVEWHLVGADIEAAIDRGRIAADYFAIEAFRERDPERALAGRGGTDDRDQSRTDGARRHRSNAPATMYNASAVSARNSPTCCARDGTFITSRRAGDIR